jgi:hypothetical protein
VAGNRVEVRVRTVWDEDVVSERFVGCGYDHTDDAAYAVASCVDATLPRPLAVLGGAVGWLAESRTTAVDAEEDRLAQALTDAAAAYSAYWDRLDKEMRRPAPVEEG